MTEVLALVFGVGLAAAGGELFVRGAVGVAHALRVPPGIVAATIAAFATSSPELSVAVTAALAGDPKLALGNALGANVVNVALILGIVLAMSAMRASPGSARRDLPVALLVPAVTGLLLVDGALSRLDGLLLLVLFAAWLVAAVLAARRERSSVDQVLGMRLMWMAVAHGASGLALLLASGYLIVLGAKALALSLGIDEFVVGATVVALGTTAPELATALVARMRGHDEVGLGTLLGSNIFNGLAIVGAAAVLHPITADWREVAIALVFGSVALAFTWPGRDGTIERRRGVLLLVLYAGYLAALIQVQPG